MYSYRPMISDTMYQDYLLKESLKEQIIAQLLAQRINLPSNGYQRALEETTRELLQEINRLQWIQEKAGDGYNPRVRGGDTAFVSQLNGTGRLEDVIKTLDTKTRSKIQGWLNMLDNGQGKGFLYGLGMAALLGILLPSNGHKIQSMVFNTAHEGMSLLERARSMVAKVKEEFEDIIAEANFKQQQENFAEAQFEAESSTKDAWDRMFH